MAMKEMSFEMYMAAQVAAIEASGMAPEAWIAKFAAAFRSAWEKLLSN
jgi:hypothetical protein